MRGLLSLMVVAVVAGSLPVLAQQSSSLADVARKEAERRKAVKAPVKVYTNADVKKHAPLPSSAVPPAPAAKPAVETPPSESAGAEAAEPSPPPSESAGAEAAEPSPPPSEKPQPASAPDETRDEAWYRKRMADMQEGLSRTRMAVDAYQDRINGLWAAFTARDDPAQRAVIERDRLLALAELERLKTEVTKFEQAIADFEEQARRAGIPPGWLR
jgi:hypothetical protein